MFVITWSDEAFDQMQSLFRNHPEFHTGFKFALNSIAHHLSVHPEQMGESRDAHVRVWFTFDVLVTYVILSDRDDEDDTVEILTIKLARRKPS